MRQAELIEAKWDWGMKPEGWIVRIRCTDGRTVDTVPPLCVGWCVVDDEDARELIEAALKWEEIQADENLIREAIKGRIGP